MKRLIIAFFLCVGTAFAADIPVHSGDSLQTKIDASACGDRLLLDAGVTWDGNFILPNHSCTSGTPTRLTSSLISSFASARVSPGLASSMPRIRTTTNSAAVLKLATNAGSWIVDGIEITENITSGSFLPILVEFGSNNPGTHDNTIMRCYIHQKETGTTNYTRYVYYALANEGDNFTLKWNYFAPFIGYPEGGGDPIGVDFVTGGPNTGTLIEDNFLAAQYAELFLGGGDTGPTHTATLTGATTTSATFSDVTGITVGIVIRFEVKFNATVSNTVAGCNPQIPAVLCSTLTRNSGATMVAGQDEATFDGSGGLAASAGVLKFPSGFVGDIRTVTNANSYLMQHQATSGLPTDGVAYDIIQYKTARVTNVVGNVVTYSPFGADKLTQSPNGDAAWCAVGEGLVNDFTVRKNTFFTDPVFVNYVHTLQPGTDPKGIWEVKNCNNMLVEGNRFTGWPLTAGWVGSNQNGAAPWITVSNIIIRNNWYAPDIITGRTSRPIGISENQYRTGTPATNVQIYNNFFKNCSLIFPVVADSVSFTHNTAINNKYDGSETLAIISAGGVLNNFVFNNNIVAYGTQGMYWSNVSPNTFAQAYLHPGDFRGNVVVDDHSAGFGTGQWQAGNTPADILTPIKTAFSQVGFTNLAGDNYRLLNSSAFYHAATDGTDPGINQDTLEAALGGAGGTLTCNWNNAVPVCR